MHRIFEELVRGLARTDRIREDMIALLCRSGQQQTAEHCLRVGDEARRLALRFDVDVQAAECAGWLHDISAVYPPERRSEISRQVGVQVLPEEDVAPMILHQKLSAAMARQIFGVGHQGVLSAIRCHTTLKADAATLDKVVFVADKIAWDQPSTPPYIEEMLCALDRSLDDGVRHYLDYLWQRRGALLVVHPWFADACRQYTGHRS